MLPAGRPAAVLMTSSVIQPASRSRCWPAHCAALNATASSPGGSCRRARRGSNTAWQRLGRSLSEPVLALGGWVRAHLTQFDAARRRFDARDGRGPATGRTVKSGSEALGPPAALTPRRGVRQREQEWDPCWTTPKSSPVADARLQPRRLLPGADFEPTFKADYAGLDDGFSVSGIRCRKRLVFGSGQLHDQSRAGPGARATICNSWPSLCRPAAFSRSRNSEFLIRRLRSAHRAFGDRRAAPISAEYNPSLVRATERVYTHFNCSLSRR